MKNIVAIAVLLTSTAQAQTWRPCGGGDSWKPHRFVPQGWKGADFRPACVQHDIDYKTHIVSRKQADLRFLHTMLTACNTSRQPIRTKIIARNMYRAVRMFGRRGYESHNVHSE